MKKKASTVLLVLAMTVGLVLLLYPSVSNYWNTLHATRAVAAYDEDVQKLDQDTYDAIWSAAEAYNRSLLTRTNSFYQTEEQQAAYEDLLNVSGNGVMGYIEIPSIDVSLPIYHGSSEGVLQVAIGHIEWSSLPVGGAGTHCVLSGHRGLPSAKLFTDLDQLDIGDTFILRILDEMLTYEVDQILIVEPSDVTALAVEQGKDLCTLVTCTPYGINSHRMLVRGRRVENAAEVKTVRVTSDAVQIEPLLVAPVAALPLLLILLLVLLFSTSKRKPSGGTEDETNTQ